MGKPNQVPNSSCLLVRTTILHVSEVPQDKYERRIGKYEQRMGKCERKIEKYAIGLIQSQSQSSTQLYLSSCQNYHPVHGTMDQVVGFFLKHILCTTKNNINIAKYNTPVPLNIYFYR